MDYKIIAMDFDGTLLTSDKKVTEKTRNMLLEYKNNGYITFGVTGRVLSRVKSCCDINIFDYLILGNGSYIYNVKKNSTELAQTIKGDTLKSISKHFADIKIWYLSLERYYMYNDKEPKTEDYAINIKDESEIKEPIGKIVIFPKNNEDIVEHVKYINNNFGELELCEMTDTDKSRKTNWIEVTPKGVNKLETLKLLCQKLNISISQVVFFGDAGNDLPLIGQVGLGVAMGNAIEEVKNKAKAVTLSNDEDGIAVFLENLKKNRSKFI